MQIDLILHRGASGKGWLPPGTVFRSGHYLYERLQETLRGSRKTILANNGEFVETVFFEEDNVKLEKYRIRL